MARTFVLLHGAFHGGWCWAHVAARLIAAGHRVTTPTQTGLGERRHLISDAITVDTFIADLVNHLEAEEIENAVLVGHSFGGIAISGAADRVPERIGQLIYLDSRLVQDGQCQFDTQPAEVVAARHAAAEAFDGGHSCPPPPAASFGIPDGADADWVNRRLTPQPMGAFTSVVRLNGPLGNHLPATYIGCTAPYYGTQARFHALARSQPGWRWAELATGHDAMVTAPDAVAALFQEIAA